jgi:hypothetical protein
MDEKPTIDREALRLDLRVDSLKVREFHADSAGQARKEASRWMGDFSQHGILEIETMQVEHRGDQFVLVLRYFEDGRNYWIR